MTRKLVFSAAFAIVVSSWAGTGWGQKGEKNGGKKAEAVPESINRQFQWEEKVVGPKEKGVDHKKIAAMQERARREEAAHQNDPPPTKKRAQGVAAPASATLPTMDIEKPAPAGASTPHKAAKKSSYAEQERARPKDALDNLLADEAGDGSSASSGGGRSGLRNVFASDDDKRARPTHAVSKKPRGKKHRRN